MMRVRLEVNRRMHDIEARPGATLLGVLRDDLRLTGTRYGCGHGICGACVVLVDGVATPSCQVPAEEASGRSVVTIEGLASGDTLHPVQRAFVDEDAMQCGYCTSGMIMSAVALLGATPHPSDDQIRHALNAHLCRCGVYMRVVRAVKSAAQ
jgi:aerobic-type carbon monoxide dehydrogenase small subunit (CoxS/CutS family)